MRITHLLLLFLLVSSCKSLNDYQNQKISLVEGNSQKFSNENNVLLTNLFVNGKKGTFLFDTGAMSSVITNKLFISSFVTNKKNYYTSIKMKGATGMTIESKSFVSDSISSTIIRGKKNIFKHLEVQSNEILCAIKDTVRDGIVGFDIFKRSGQPILLNFENNTIDALTRNYNTIGYQKLDVKIPAIGSKITIPFMIDNIKTDFLFDTGNAGGFLISQKECKIEDSKIFLECETLVGIVNGFSTEKIKMYKDVSIKYNDIIDIRTNITSFPILHTNTLGISFIKNFNWILDFNTGMIYVKKITKFSNNENNSDLVKTKLKSGVINGKLIIGFKNLAFLFKHNVGDQITAINNIIVTPENICEMQDLLNKTEDWNTLNLEVVSATK